MGNFNRPYELSIFSLQDEFILVLKEMNVDNLLQIHEPKLTLKDDGTQELTFSIPMYYRENNVLVENPLWYNTQNGNIIAGLRKVRVCFNKGDKEKEKIFDFVIKKVTEKHEKGTLFCEIEAEGIAFNELGKIGYKLVLNQEEFEVDYEEYWNKLNEWQEKKDAGEATDEDKPEELIASLNYWCDKVFTQVKNWDYRIQMDWTVYGNSERSTEKLYEDEYVSDWAVKDGKLVPNAMESYREKARIPSCEKSNVYNITQSLAELFEVFCRYEYSYDINGHITGRTCVFYNNFLQDENPLDIFYNYDTNTISREMDCSELITKMYVTPIDDDTRLAGQITIATSDANKTREDYLLNFEYLYSIGGIDDIQYNAISEYETQMREYNLKLEELSNKIDRITVVRNELNANLTLAKNQVKEAAEQVNDANKTIQKILAPLKEDKKSGGYSITNKLTSIYVGKNGCEISIPDEGVLFNSNASIILRYYPTSDYNVQLDDEMKSIKLKCDSDIATEGTYDSGSFTIVRDENNYVTSIIKFIRPSDWNPNYTYCRLDYSYKPAFVYEQIVETYTSLLNNLIGKEAIKDALADEAANSKEDRNYTEGIIGVYTNKIAAYDDELEAAQTEYDTLLAEKKRLIIDFDGMMGPALKEGYWQDDDYKDYGSKKIGSFHWSTVAESDDSIQCAAMIDSYALDGETEDWYEEGVGVDNVKYRLGFKLSNILDNEDIITNWDKVVILYSVNPSVTEDQYIGSKIHQETQLDTIDASTSLKYMFNNVAYDTYEAAKTAAEKAYEDEYGNKAYDSFIFLSQLDCEYYKDGDGNIQPIAFFPETTDITDIYIEGNALPKLAIYDITKITDTSGGTIYINGIKQTDIYWLLKTDSSREKGQTVYYRLRIPNDELLVDDEKFSLSLNGNELTRYTDFSLTYRDLIEKSTTEYEEDRAYYVVPKPLSIWKSLGKIVNMPTTLDDTYKFTINFAISTAAISMYLDALEVMKTNCFPQVSYDIKLQSEQENLIRYTYDYLGSLCRIEDTQLKFHNVAGYISEIEMSLDQPWEDSITIKNYKTRFEDLFSRIVASSEQMKLNSVAYNTAAQAFTSSGELTIDALSAEVMEKIEEQAELKASKVIKSNMSLISMKDKISEMENTLSKFKNTITQAAENAKQMVSDVDNRVATLMDGSNKLSLNFDFDDNTEDVYRGVGIHLTSGGNTFKLDGKNMGFYDSEGNLRMGFGSGESGWADKNILYVNGAITATEGGNIGGFTVTKEGYLSSQFMTLGEDLAGRTVFAIKDGVTDDYILALAPTDEENEVYVEEEEGVYISNLFEEEYFGTAEEAWEANYLKYVADEFNTSYSSNLDRSYFQYNEETDKADFSELYYNLEEVTKEDSIYPFDLNELDYKTLTQYRYGQYALTVKGTIYATEGGQIGGLSILKDGTLGNDLMSLGAIYDGETNTDLHSVLFNLKSPYTTESGETAYNSVFSFYREAPRCLTKTVYTTDEETGEITPSTVWYISGSSGGTYNSKDEALTAAYETYLKDNYSIVTTTTDDGGVKTYTKDGNTITDLSEYITYQKYLELYQLKVKGNIEANKFTATGPDGSYFSVDSDSLRFMDTSGNKMLYYDTAANGLQIEGKILATGLEIVSTINDKTITQSIADYIGYRLDIISNPEIITADTDTVTLTAKVYQGNNEVTSLKEDGFIWYKDNDITKVIEGATSQTLTINLNTTDASATYCCKYSDE